MAELRATLLQEHVWRTREGLSPDGGKSIERTAKRGGSFRIRPVSVPVSNGRYGRAIPPRRLVVSTTPAIAAASSAAMPAPAPNDVQSIALPPEVAGVVTVPG